MNRKLYMVSLGPGDIELLTLKACRAFRESSVICVPTKSADSSFKKSISYKIVTGALEFLGIQREIIPIYSPMAFDEEDWNNQTEILIDSSYKHSTLCFVTLGDAAVYSSIYYLLDILKHKDKTLYENSEIIAGVTSFSASSAIVKKPLCLGDESLIIRPINPREELQSTEILMRPKVGMKTEALGEGNFYTFENLYLSKQNISPFKIDKVKRYMTLFINFASRKEL